MRFTKQLFMRIFLPLLVLGLPPTCATLDGSAIDVGENHGVIEGSNDIIKTAPQASFLSPSYILEVVQQNAYLPSALRARGAEQSPSDFWEMAKESEKNLQEYVHSLLEEAATYSKSTHFTDIISTMNLIVSTTATFRANIQGALDAHDITFDTLTEELEGIFVGILNNLPPPDEAPDNCAERAEMVDKILDDVARELIKLTTHYGIKEDFVTSYIAALKPKVHALIVTICYIHEQCPHLLPFLLFSVAVLLIPELWILKPLLRLFGFGPAGPVKGWAAAWMQRYFFGAAVGAGSWFSFLQAAGMGALPGWAGLVIKVPSLMFGGVMTWLQCRNL